MAQHVLLPNGDIKTGWTEDPVGSTNWNILESPKFGRLITTNQGPGGSGANEARVDFTTFTLAAGETVTDVVVNVYAVLPAGKTITFNLANNAGAIGGTNTVGSGAALPLGTGSSHTFSGYPFNQANIDSLTVGFFPGNENTSQVELHAVHINIRTTGGPLLAYDQLASQRIRRNNLGQDFSNPFDGTISGVAGPQGGDEWETVRLPPVAGIPRTLWIVDDAVFADGPGIQRSGSDAVHGPIIHSIFGIQYGLDLTNPVTTIDWYPGVEDSGGEGQYIGSFMAPIMINGTPYYRWPQAGVTLDDEVLLIAGSLIQTHPLPNPPYSAAETVGTWLSRYTNITDTPDNWVEEVADWRVERLWGNTELGVGYGGRGDAPAMGLSDPGDGYVYGVFGQAWSPPGATRQDIWGVLRFSRADGKTSGAVIRPEYWDGQQWVMDSPFTLSNARSWMRRRRPIDVSLAAIKPTDQPPGSMLFTFGSVFKRPVDGQWMLTGMDLMGASCWYAVKSSITGPFTPLINAGPNNAAIYGGGFAYGGVQHWEQTWPGRGNDHVLISHTGNGAVTKMVANWPGMYRLTGT